MGVVGGQGDGSGDTGGMDGGSTGGGVGGRAGGGGHAGTRFDAPAKNIRAPYCMLAHLLLAVPHRTPKLAVRSNVNVMADACWCGVSALGSLGFGT